MDHLPAAQAHAYMGDVPLVIVFGKEEQVTDFERRLDRSGRPALHIGIAGDVDPDPAMEQSRQPGTVDAIAAQSPQR